MEKSFFFKFIPVVPLNSHELDKYYVLNIFHYYLILFFLKKKTNNISNICSSALGQTLLEHVFY